MEVQLRSDRQGWITNYLTIWQGFLGLTERELEVLTLIAERYLVLQVSVQSPELLAELLLSPAARLQIRAQIEVGDTHLSANGLQNYLTSLRDKGALQVEGNNLTLMSKLVPQQDLTFHFTVSK